MVYLNSNVSIIKINVSDFSMPTKTEIVRLDKSNKTYLHASTKTLL